MKIFINSGKVSIVNNNIALVLAILLMFLNQAVVSYLCSGSISATSAITSTHNTFDITSSSTLYSIKSGTVSNSNYFLFLLNDISAVAIRKVSSNGTQNWITSYSFTPAVKSLTIDPSEQYLYFVDISSPICVVRLQTSDGSLFSVNDL